MDDFDRVFAFFIGLALLALLLPAVFLKWAGPFSDLVGAGVNRL